MEAGTREFNLDDLINRTDNVRCMVYSLVIELVQINDYLRGNTPDRKESEPAPQPSSPILRGIRHLDKAEEDLRFLGQEVRRLQETVGFEPPPPAPAMSPGGCGVSSSGRR